jgi:hypothetical protein
MNNIDTRDYQCMDQHIGTDRCYSARTEKPIASPKKYDIKQLRGAWGAGKGASTATDQFDCLVYKWFCSYDKKKCGQITGILHKEHYLLNIYDEESFVGVKMIICNFAELMQWTFFEREDDLRVFLHLHSFRRLSELKHQPA